MSSQMRRHKYRGQLTSGLQAVTCQPLVQAIRQQQSFRVYHLSLTLVSSNS